MIRAQPTPDEVHRLAALREYAVLDTLPEQSLDELTSLAAAICGTPVAMISLVDEHRQWFKSRVGVEAAETARDISFCGHAVHQRDLFIVPDATLDDRFTDNPLVTGAPNVRFYAGAPLVTPEGAALGALCVIDHVPRTLTDAQQQALRVLARQVMTHLDLRRQTHELIESESKFRLLAENITDVFWIASPDLQKIYYVSPGYEQIWGCSAESLYAHPHQWAEAILPEERKHVLGVFATLMESAPSVSVEYRIARPDGTVRWVHDRGFQVRDAAGRLVRLTGIVADITERKKAEEVLRDVSSKESGRHQRKVFQELGVIFALSVLVFVTCFELGLSNESFAYSAAHGQGADTLLDETIFTLVFFCLGLLVFSYRRWRESQKDVLSQTEISKALSVMHSDMEAQVRQRTAELIKSNESLRAEAAERQRAEAVIKQFPAIIESSDDAIISKTLGGIVTTWNPAAERMFGYTAPEMIGKPITVLFPPDRLQEENEILAHIARGERVRHFETVRVRKDGRHLDVSATISPIKDADGKITGVSKIVRDITERKEAGDQLRGKTAILEAQLDSTLDGILIVDNDGNKIIQNRRMAEMWGIPREFAEDVDDRKQFEWVAGRNKNPRQFTEKIAYLHAHPEEISRDELELADGRFFDRYSAPVRGQDGKYYGRIWVVRDVSERKLTENELHRERDFVSAVVDTVGSLVVVLDRQAAIVRFNRACEQLTGYSFEEVKGRNAIDLLIVPEEKAAVTAEFQNLCAGQFPNTHENNWVNRQGNHRVIAWSNTALLDANGAVEYVIGTGTDITERKRAEEKIAEQASFLDKARDAIVVSDLDGKVLYWNKGAEQMYGWPRQEVVGQNNGELLYTDPKKFEEVNGLTISQGEWHGELQHVTKNQREIAVEARWTLIRDNEGNPKSVLAINTDITEKKKLEAQFMRAQRMESIGTLAGGVAHDLNNILAPIMMSIDVLKEISEDPQAKIILDTIEVSAKRGADIVRQVLSFARGLEGERIEVQPKHLFKDLENIIKDTFPKDIRLQFSAPNDTWTILGDPTQVHQILLNLCVNARDAMPNGGNLTIGVENCMLDEQYAAMNIQAKAGRYVMISVTDSGTGIPRDILDKIFEPFFTTKDLHKGTGLGLSTVNAIVKSHDGVINVYSELGKGTTFKVYLPAIETSSETGKEQSEQLRLPRGNGETVLVVDDEASILTITSQTLQAFGYRVLTAVNGAAAVAVYAEHKNEIAVVLTDMMMPVMDGSATIHALTQINPTIKIIAASGLNANGAEVTASGAGAKHFLVKPYTAATLLKTIRTVLDEA